MTLKRFVICFHHMFFFLVEPSNRFDPENKKVPRGCLQPHTFSLSSWQFVVLSFVPSFTLSFVIRRMDETTKEEWKTKRKKEKRLTVRFAADLKHALKCIFRRMKGDRGNLHRQVFFCSPWKADDIEFDDPRQLPLAIFSSYKCKFYVQIPWNLILQRAPATAWISIVIFEMFVITWGFYTFKALFYCLKCQRIFCIHLLKSGNNEKVLTAE